MLFATNRGFERGHVEVELLASPRLQGLTFWQPNRKGNHEVALQVNQERFFEHYFGIFQ